MLGEQIRYYRKKLCWNQSKLAAHLGVTQQAVGKWETGRSTPDPSTLMRLAECFGVSTDALLGRKESSTVPVQPYIPAAEVLVPVLGAVRAGYGALAFEEYKGNERANVRDPENYFYLLVQGDSMEPRIQNGDLALVRRQPTLDDGDLGVVVYGEGEGTLKRFLRRGNTVMLQPFNPTYETVVLEGEELEHLFIAGKVVETKAKW